MKLLPNDLIYITTTDEGSVIHSKNYNVEIMVFDKTGEVIKELSESLLKRSQIEWETSVKASDFIMDCIHKINVNQGG